VNDTENQLEPTEPAWWSPAGLGPRASAIAAFTLAVISLLGQSTWTTAAQALFFGPNFPQSSLRWWFLSVLLAPIIPAMLGLVLARRVLVPRSDGAWELSLSRAAVVISEIGILLGVIAAVANLLRY
jgi:hypothetical protein